jgi:hypothetical protein
MTSQGFVQRGFSRLVMSVIVLALAAGCSSSDSPDLLAGPSPTVQTGSDSPATTAYQSVYGAAGTTTQTESPASTLTTARMLPPGSALPSDSDCAARVVKAPEVRPGNKTFNNTRGRQKGIREKWLDRVTGDFTGTTDEILQWGACKWGIDPDIVRAQAAKESYWHMSTLGDYGSKPAECPPAHPIGVDGRPGLCPESVGLLQARYLYSGPPAGRPTWPEIEESTAYNVDFAYAYWRSCYEGDLTWLNTADRGRDYAAGDVWGCVGAWFSGRWYTADANQYVAAVRDYANTRIWTTASFINAR